MGGLIRRYLFGAIGSSLKTPNARQGVTRLRSRLADQTRLLGRPRSLNAARISIKPFLKCTSLSR